MFTRCIAHARKERSARDVVALVDQALDGDPGNVLRAHASWSLAHVRAFLDVDRRTLSIGSLLHHPSGRLQKVA